MTHAERAYLQLAARRQLHARAKQPDTPAQAEVPLECGVSARLEFYADPPRQELWLRHGTSKVEALAEIAEEIFGYSPEVAPSGENGLYLFIRRY